MNWGHKLTIVIATFIVAMLGMVYIASKQTNEMIDEKYYEKELVYQDLINAKKNLEQFTDSTLLHQEQGIIFVKLPKEISQNIEEGTIRFLRNEAQSKDVSMKLNPDGNGLQIIDKSSLHKGWYTLRIRWKSNQKEFYSEENLNIL